jgi:hypothetical protein
MALAPDVPDITVYILEGGIMRTLFTGTVSFAMWTALAPLAAGAAAPAAAKSDPIDAAIERTKQPKTETLAEAIRYEKMKDEAAARQASLEKSGRPDSARTNGPKPKAKTEPVASARK